MFDLSKRVHDPEIMDELSHSDTEFTCAYRELALINRYLGGTRAIERFLPRLNTTGWLLDIAAGACDVSDHVARTGRWHMVALDRNPNGLRLARISAPVVGDAFSLPFREGSFDLVTASLFFHHLRDSDCVRLLRSMHRVARRMVIINDLRRTRIAYASILCLTRVFSRSLMVRNDGPLSVRRGFTPSELRDIARKAGLGGVVRRSFPYRLVLVIEK